MIALALALALALVVVLFSIPTRESFYAIPTGEERPFVNVYDENRNQLKIVLLSHPFTRDSSYKQYEQYRKDGFVVLGITSYNEFPRITSNKHDVLNNPSEKAWVNYDYMEIADGWLHCFRDPDAYITSGKTPILLLSESDFCNTDTFKPNPTIKKKYDFIYICPKDAGDKCEGWVATNKNWELAQKCIAIMCRDYGLKGLLVGRKDCKVPDNCDTTGFLSQLKLLEAYHESKFLFLPNVTDASPRILTEAMNCDLPILVNANIVGGWKYVHKNSGAFFTKETDLKPGLEYILNRYQHLTPRQHFLEHYGKEKSGKKLKKFIQKHYSNTINVSDYKYLTL